MDFVNLNSKVTILCDIHGEFLQTVNLHLNGRGCKICNLKKGTLRYTTETFIEDARKFHGDWFDYSQTIYKSGHERVIIVCPVHGALNITPSGHLQNDCRRCVDEGRRTTTEEFVTRSHAVHNNKYMYEKTVYVRCDQGVMITCPTHGDFEQRASCHLAGSGCYKCYLGQPSKKSIFWLEWMAVQTNQHIQHAGNGEEYLIPGSRFKADGFNPDTNTIWEFYGTLWHSSPLYYDLTAPHPFIKNKTHGEVYQKTLDRLQWIRGQGYQVEYVWEQTFDAIVKRAIRIQRAWRAYKGIVRQKKTRSDKGSKRAARALSSS